MNKTLAFSLIALLFFCTACRSGTPEHTEAVVSCPPGLSETTELYASQLGEERADVYEALALSADQLKQRRPGEVILPELETLMGLDFAVSLSFDLETDILLGFRYESESEFVPNETSSLAENVFAKLIELYGQPRHAEGKQHNSFLHTTNLEDRLSLPIRTTLSETWTIDPSANVELHPVEGVSDRFDGVGFGLAFSVDNTPEGDTLATRIALHYSLSVIYAPQKLS